MIYLYLSIVSEIIATVSMKFADGFSNIPASIITFIFYILSFISATLALKYLDMGFFYATWSATCIVILAIIGLMFFHEHLNILKLASAGLIIIGIIGFNLSGQS